MIALSTPDRQIIVQMAWHVADVEAAIPRFAALLGCGPFLLRRHIGLQAVQYRGAPAALDISAAHAQSGGIQIELVMQHDDAPSAFRDAFAADAQGLHHVAICPEDHDAMVAHYRAQGFAVATDLWTAEGRGASYVDTRPALGHMVEIYRPNPSLHDLYARVAGLQREAGGRLVIEA